MHLVLCSPVEVIFYVTVCGTIILGIALSTRDFKVAFVTGVSITAFVYVIHTIVHLYRQGRVVPNDDEDEGFVEDDVLLPSGREADPLARLRISTFERPNRSELPKYEDLSKRSHADSHSDKAPSYNQEEPPASPNVAQA